MSIPSRCKASLRYAIGCFLLDQVALAFGSRCLRAETMRARPRPLTMPVPTAAQVQARNPLHGLTLQTVLTSLVHHYGWSGLAERIPLRCFCNDPSIGSSLKVLRRMPWAREKVEGLYLFMLRDVRRAGAPRAPR